MESIVNTPQSNLNTLQVMGPDPSQSVHPVKRKNNQKVEVTVLKHVNDGYINDIITGSEAFIAGNTNRKRWQL